MSETVLRALHPDNSTDATSKISFPTVAPNSDPSGAQMSAVTFAGKNSIKVVRKPKPAITDPEDAIIRVTASGICGTDLHFMHMAMAGMEPGMILGHEVIGIVESVGPEVQKIKVGDRVAVTPAIACGSCEFCYKELYSLCDRTNPNKTQEQVMGHRVGGIIGGPNLCGGYPGGQAEFLRMPYADVNLFKASDGITDEQLVTLTDIAPTAWQACLQGEVSEGKDVVVWGCGPVGLLVQMWCTKVLGARRVIAIDGERYRLDKAATHLGVETVNFREHSNIVKVIQDMMPGGPDVCIDAVGLEGASGWLHTVERAVGLETDSAEVINQAITLCRKGGIISLIGEYGGYANHINIGAFMEKGLTMRGSHVHCQKHFPQLSEWVAEGRVDPSFVLTHSGGLDDAPHFYKIFDKKEDHCIKAILKPGFTARAGSGGPN